MIYSEESKKAFIRGMKAFALFPIISYGFIYRNCLMYDHLTLV